MTSASSYRSPPLHKITRVTGTDGSRISLSSGEGKSCRAHCRSGSISRDFRRISDDQINERVSTMEISVFKSMYLSELQELMSVEEQLADALLRMAGAASNPALKRLLIHHRAETETQRDRLVTILQMHGASPTAHTDQAMQAPIVATKKMPTTL